MTILRWFLGKVILMFDQIFSPTPRERSPEEKSKIESAMRGLEIYQFEACPFCVKVRRFMKAENFSVPLRDAKTEPYRSELVKGGGKAQVPCLKITDDQGSVRWMYESNDIIDFLAKKLPDGGAAARA